MKYVKYHINVTQDHIDRGYRHKADCCPVALAIQEQTDMQDVTVTSTKVEEYRSGEIVYPPVAATGHLPREVSLFIVKYDNGVEPVSPFEFDLEMIPA